MSGERPDLLSTYRHLRLAMPMLMGMLLVAVALRAQSAPGGACFEGSISAYYFTSVRAVFVVVLCALGTCLIVYRGNGDPEDVALNAAGALAFVVAFVPTKVPGATGIHCTASNVPDPEQIDAAVNNNMVAMIITSFVVIPLAMYLVHLADPRSKLRRRALWAFFVVLVLGSVAFARWPEGFRDNAHMVAAFGTFIGILAVVLINACDAGKEPHRRTGFRTIYLFIALAMAASVAILALLYWKVSGWRHGLLFIETALLLEFLIFWVVQTVELWPETRRGVTSLAAVELGR